jgi:hypothetical protein
MRVQKLWRYPIIQDYINSFKNQTYVIKPAPLSVFIDVVQDYYRDLKFINVDWFTLLTKLVTRLNLLEEIMPGNFLVRQESSLANISFLNVLLQLLNKYKKTLCSLREYDIPGVFLDPRIELRVMFDSDFIMWDSGPLIRSVRVSPLARVSINLHLVYYDHVLNVIYANIFVF